MFKRGPLFLILFALLLAACAPKAAVPVYEEMSAYEGKDAVMPQAPAMEMEGRPVEASGNYDSSVNAVDRLVIRNADLSIVVRSPVEVLDGIMQMADEMGGFVVNSNVYQRQTPAGIQVQEAQVTIRVPAAQLGQAMSRIKAYVENPDTDILNETITGQDVTREYTDLQSRLRNLEEAAEQLRKIMETATRPEDVLAVFNELKNVTEQIELIKGQIQYFEESAAMSAISVYIQAQESIAPLTVAGWKPQGVAREALRTLITAYQFIADAIIWGVLFCLPIVLPVGVVGFFIVRGIKRMRRSRKAAKAATFSDSAAKVEIPE